MTWYDPATVRMAYALYRLWRWRRWQRRQPIKIRPFPEPRFWPGQPRSTRDNHDVPRSWIHRPKLAGYDTPNGFVPYDELLKR